MQMTEPYFDVHLTEPRLRAAVALDALRERPEVRARVLGPIHGAADDVAVRAGLIKEPGARIYLKARQRDRGACDHAETTKISSLIVLRVR